MNKILSILAICVVLGVASAQWTSTPYSYGNASMLSTLLGTPLMARYVDSSRVTFLWAKDTGVANVFNIVRVYANTTFNGPYQNNTNTSTAGFAVTLRYCTTANTIKMTYSQNGYVGIACGGANVYYYIFKTDANLTTNGSIVESPALAVATSGVNYIIEEATFQDDYFYVTFFGGNGIHYVQGVNAKTPSTLSATAATPVNAAAILGTVTRIDCVQREKGNNTGFCTYNDATNTKARAVTYGTGETAGTNSFTLNPINVTDNVAIKTRAYYGGLSYVSNGASSNFTVLYDNATSNVINVTAPSNISNANMVLYKTVPYFDQNFFALYADAGTNNLYYSVFVRGNATTTINSTVTLGQIGAFVGDFILQDQSYWILYVDTTGNLNIAQAIGQTGSTKFGVALKSAIAGIFFVGALLFAF